MDPAKKRAAAEFRLNLPPFLYTLDQIAQSLAITEDHLREKYVHFVSPGNREKLNPNKMIARNISNSSAFNDWRITDSEFLRWMKHKGFKPMELWDMF